MIYFFAKFAFWLPILGRGVGFFCTSDYILLVKEHHPLHHRRGKTSFFSSYFSPVRIKLHRKKTEKRKALGQKSALENWRVK